MTGALAVSVLATGGLLVASDLQARTEVRTTHVALASTVGRLSGLRTELARAEHALAGARAESLAATASFDAAQSTLSTTQATLARDQAGIWSQGVDRGMLDTCVGGVEQALNQLAVGQTAGGLGSMRASSPSCAALARTG